MAVNGFHDKPPQLGGQAHTKTDTSALPAESMKSMKSRYKKIKTDQTE